MKTKAITILLLLIFSYFPLAHAETRYGFKDIPFGLSYAETLRRAKKLKDSDGENVWIREGSYQWYFQIERYMIGDEPCKIGFSFDHTKRFYKFILYSRICADASYYDVAVKHRVIFFNEVFKQKYGIDYSCTEFPSLLSLNKGFISIMCSWKNDTIHAYTGVSEGPENELHYCAVGVVEDIGLAEEYSNHQKEEEKKGISKGAKDF